MIAPRKQFCATLLENILTEFTSNSLQHSLGFHSDVTFEFIRANFEFTLEFSSLSLGIHSRTHIQFTSGSPRIHSEQRHLFDATFEFTSMSCSSFIRVASMSLPNSLRCHFDFMFEFASNPHTFRFRIQLDLNTTSLPKPLRCDVNST